MQLFFDYFFSKFKLLYFIKHFSCIQCTCYFLLSPITSNKLKSERTQDFSEAFPDFFFFYQNAALEIDCVKNSSKGKKKKKKKIPSKYIFCPEISLITE